MRLTCPNCSAQYEVPDEVIPEEGRDVQCSNCEETWFQAKNPAEPASAPEPAAPDAATDEAPEPASPPADDMNEPAEAQPAEAKSGVDPSVASILKEEAAREAELRAKEGGGLESQPDLALEPVAKPAPATQSVPVETAADAGQKVVEHGPTCACGVRLANAHRDRVVTDNGIRVHHLRQHAQVPHDRQDGRSRLRLVRRQRGHAAAPAEQADLLDDRRAATRLGTVGRGP